jgi:hypothetical protein
MSEARRNGDDALTIVHYEARMLDAIVEMLCDQYGGSAEARRQAFVRFYDHPYQAGHALRLVAVSAGKPVGLQTLFRWPYRNGDRLFRSLQSGNSLIHRDWRGKGLFGKMLAAQDSFMDRTKVDFLTGFPVDASLGSFKRNGWLHIGDTRWRVVPLNPFAALFPREPAKIAARFDVAPEAIDVCHRNEAFTLDADAAFLNWRMHTREPAERCWHHFRDDSGIVRCDLKIERRGRFPLLVVGAVEATTLSPDSVAAALADLARRARGAGAAALAISANPDGMDPGIRKFLSRRISRQLANRAHFIVKPVAFAKAEAADFSRWQLQRHDIDTW